ncbi:MAG: type II secretion protein, partial [Gimesia sp.]|nr:type II secretion protein [Gimesia sp.]
MKQIKIHNRQQRRGFTLLEMLIVLGIILVIAAMVVPNLLGSQKKANIK